MYEVKIQLLRPFFLARTKYMLVKGMAISFRLHFHSLNLPSNNPEKQERSSSFHRRGNSTQTRETIDPGPGWWPTFCCVFVVDDVLPDGRWLTQSTLNDVSVQSVQYVWNLK